MSENFILKPIAHIHNDFSDKFGIPRQSGLVDDLESVIVFEPEFRNAEALRGLEGFSYIWLIWQFTKAVKDGWSPTVRPPRLGGNKRVGVFATRSPFRPNPIGLSSVGLKKNYKDNSLGYVLYVSGADLLDGTPIYDIKPYLPNTDCHPDALSGFAEEFLDYSLNVECSDELLAVVSQTKQKALLGVLAQDPRPSYQNDPERVYGLVFAGYEIRFTVKDNILTVIDIIEREVK
ncbi:MAG: tRNA (N6-threonylcarbamoyladenosine(37)-N6)-methyltransferase TrmO [Clostridiales bacterium]|nr:MAG: tRNA (N6-threonylcarbamoyladenosine(37)-N6)-methyltransferase TrmO [Clostridiales bacterium]